MELGSRNPDTLWKLVEAQCSQIGNTISSARLPLLIGLTWTLLWAWQIYGEYFGYLNVYSTRYVGFESLAEAYANPLEQQTVAGKLRDVCEHMLPSLYEKGELQQLLSEKDRTSICINGIKTRYDWSQKALQDSRLVAFPGGFGSITNSDLGTAGAMGLLLILIWEFYAYRRENHAIRSFVDQDEHSRRVGGLAPSTFVLVPQAQYFSAGHYAFAYQAVSQRFLFLFSRHSRPLVLTTVLLLFLPILVALINFATDMSYLYLYDGLVEPSIYLRLIMESGVFVLMAGVTYGKITYTLDTSVLLNGWYLAVRDVWMPQWDERNQDPAPRVRIDTVQQQAAVDHA